MSLINRFIGLGEGIGSLFLSYETCKLFDGHAPWYVAVPYFIVNTGLVLDGVSRGVLGESFYGLKERGIVLDDVKIDKG